MAKFGELEITQPNGGSSCGFQSLQVIQSGVSVHANGRGVTISVDRDMEDYLKATDLTLEEAWVLYTSLRGMFLKTRQAEQELYKNKYNKD